MNRPRDCDSQTAIFCFFFFTINFIFFLLWQFEWIFFLFSFQLIFNLVSDGAYVCLYASDISSCKWELQIVLATLFSIANKVKKRNKKTLHKKKDMLGYHFVNMKIKNKTASAAERETMFYCWLLFFCKLFFQFVLSSIIFPYLKKRGKSAANKVFKN